MTIGFISHPDCALHEMGPTHPEQPARLQVIQDELTHIGLFNQLKHYEAPLVERDQLLRAHEEKYVDFIFNSSPLEGRVQLDPDTAMNPATLMAALRAAGAAILAVDLVMQNEVKAVFCSVRPPGHHAEKGQALGFCIFNNVAIAAMHALSHYSLKRVVIIDFDVHHGDGTEHIVEHDDRILFCSSFQSPFYPFKGTETNNSHIINVPLPAGTDGQRFREEVSQAWFERIEAFQPEMIFISAGFDAYANDVMADFLLTEEDYAWITQQIKQIAARTCQGRIVSVLEGGYALNGLGPCVVAHIRELAS